MTAELPTSTELVAASDIMPPAEAATPPKEAEALMAPFNHPEKLLFGSFLAAELAPPQPSPRAAAGSQR
eukprot:6226417-Amphidinium_carterae.2